MAINFMAFVIVAGCLIAAAIIAIIVLFIVKANKNSGSKGPQGPQGLGAQGNIGPPGPSGPSGPFGPQGRLGFQGLPSSAIGTQGFQGRLGFQGFQGLGAQGRLGFQGLPSSAVGPQGLTGPQGLIVALPLAMAQHGFTCNLGTDSIGISFGGGVTSVTIQGGLHILGNAVTISMPEIRVFVISSGIGRVRFGLILPFPMNNDVFFTTIQGFGVVNTSVTSNTPVTRLTVEPTTSPTRVLLNFNTTGTPIWSGGAEPEMRCSVLLTYQRT